MKNIETLGMLEVANLLPEAKDELAVWHKTLNVFFSFAMLPILLTCLQINPFQGAFIGFAAFFCFLEYFFESRGNNALKRIYKANLTPLGRELFLLWRRTEINGELNFKRTPIFWFVIILLYVLFARAVFSV
jgi:hypothetical protein